MTAAEPSPIDPGAASTSISRRRQSSVEWLVAMVAILCFANSLPNGFVYDSIEIVERNPMVHEPGRWLDLWTVDHWYQEEGRTANRDLLYRPVALFTYRLVRTLAGPSPWPQHLVNVLLHAAICVLVVRLIRRDGASPAAALVAGLAFAVLPIHTEVVNDVVGRTDLLATLGILVALVAHRRLITARAGATRTLPDTGKVSKGARLWVLIAGVAAFGAMGSKESGVSILLLIPLFDAFWHLQATQRRGRRSWWSWPTATRLAYLVIPAAVYFALRYHAVGGRLFQQPAATKTINVLVGAPLWQHILGVFQAWGMYWQKTIWPAVLCPDYSVNAVRLATDVLDFDVLFGVAVAAGLVIAAAAAWRRGHQAVAFVVAAVMITYAPASNAFVLTQVFFAERIWYLPSVGVVMLLVAAIAPLMRRPGWLAVFALAVAAMFGRCWVRNPEWENTATVAAAAHRDHPDSVATLAVYGNVLAIEGEVERGIELLKRAVEIDPGFTVAHRALGNAYMRAGDYRRALQHWQIAEMQFPGHPESAAGLRAVSEMLSAQAASELAELKRAADEEPHDVEAELSYVRRLLELGRHNEALLRFESMEEHFAGSAAWQRQYAVALLYTGHRDAAIERYERSVALDPSDPGAYIELAALRMERQVEGDLVVAEHLVDGALELAPNDPNALILRAELMAQHGRIGEALTIYRKVLSSVPAGHPQRKLWEARAQVLGQE